MHDRPDELQSKTVRIVTGYGNLYVTVSELEGKPFEVFCVIGKSGKSITAKAEVIGRLVSLALRNDIPLKEITSQLTGIAGENPHPHGKDVIHSIPDAVGKVLERLYLGKKA